MTSPILPPALVPPEPTLAEQVAHALPRVPEAYERIAAQLEAHARRLRELGRYGRRALGEGEDVLDALWQLADEVSDTETEIDRLADAIDAEMTGPGEVPC